MIIGKERIKEIVIARKETNEVIAYLTDEHIVEKDGYKVVCVSESSPDCLFECDQDSIRVLEPH